MGGGDESGVCGIAPCGSVEMEAENEVWLDGVVNEIGAGTDFSGAVEELFGKTAEGIGIGLGGGIGEGFEILRADGGDWFWGGADEGDFGAHFAEEGCEDLGDFECHIAFGDGGIGANLEPAFFDFRPISADVAGIDGDVEVLEGFFNWGGCAGGGGLPRAGGGFGVCGGGEV